ncbi:MAG: hypothetical protein SVE93_00160 [Candidatus Thermoplasmatota archaeon]|nr:hypothetical protein [Candidatus Thermoplasmatota archaeon]
MISDAIVKALAGYLTPYSSYASMVALAIYLLAFFFLVMLFLRLVGFDGFAQIVIIILAITFLILDGLMPAVVLYLPTVGVLIGYMVSGWRDGGGE